MYLTFFIVNLQHNQINSYSRNKEYEGNDREQLDEGVDLQKNKI